MGFFNFFSKEKKETLDKGLSKTKESVFSKIARAVAVLELGYHERRKHLGIAGHGHGRMPRLAFFCCDDDRTVRRITAIERRSRSACQH